MTSSSPMATSPVKFSKPAYLLEVQGKPAQFFDSLDEAQSHASAHMAKRVKLRIESFAAPAPSQAWQWDHELDTWVYARNAAQ